MSEQRPKGERVVFAIGEDNHANKVIVLGIPEAAWARLRQGLTETFDLTKIGLALKVVVFGGKDHESVKALIPTGPDTTDVSGLDMGIDEGGSCGG